MRVDQDQEHNVLYSGWRSDRITSAESLPMSNGWGGLAPGQRVMAFSESRAALRLRPLAVLSPALRHALWEPGNVALTQKENLVQYSLFDAYPVRSDASATSSLFVRDTAGAFVPAQDKHILDAARQVADRVLPSRKDLSPPRAGQTIFCLEIEQHSGA